MKGLIKAMVIGVLAIAFLSIFPQKIPSTRVIGSYYCHYRYRLQNKDRYCYAHNLRAECGDECFPFPPFCHTAPFGNWGVDSNLGGRWNGHQFKGWHWNSIWHHWDWNSCTAEHPWDPPSCCSCDFSYYNTAQTSEGCWEQQTTEGEGVYAWTEVYIDIPEIYWDDG